MSGTLYVCGTPIGNLEDMPQRALRLLREADVIAAEDTRHTIKLLNYFGISTAMTSYHEHNKNEKCEKILELLCQGKNVALVSDAGMPGISDPGEDLIRRCYEQDIPVTVAPGATAVITALVMSGLSTKRFIFEGFLPQGKKERTAILSGHTDEVRTAVFYEAPHHLKKTLRDMFEILGDRRVALVREITKKYEEVQRGQLSFFLEYFESAEPKGEYVIVLEGVTPESIKAKQQEAWEHLSIPQHMALYTEQGMDKKQAMKAVAKDRGVSKPEIYKALCE